MSRNNPGTDDFVPASERFPKREVLEFWGRPSAGVFKRVAVVQDAVIIEPTVEAKRIMDGIIRDAQGTPMPCKTPEQREAVIARAAEIRDLGRVEMDFDEAEKRVAAAMVGQPKQRTRSRTFPNDGTLCGNYGMWRTKEEHALAVERVLKALRPIADTFDAVYCTGLSGSLPAAVACHAMQKDLLVLRKQTDRGETLSHGGLLEGPTSSTLRYMIVDDFVSGGGTLRRLMAAAPGPVVGIMLYGQPRGKDERKAGYAKLLSTYPNGEYKPCKWWYMVRRGPTSMLFDLKPVETT